MSLFSHITHLIHRLAASTVVPDLIFQQDGLGEEYGQRPCGAILQRQASNAGALACEASRLRNFINQQPISALWNHPKSCYTSNKQQEVQSLPSGPFDFAVCHPNFLDTS